MACGCTRTAAPTTSIRRRCTRTRLHGWARHLLPARRVQTLAVHVAARLLAHELTHVVQQGAAGTHASGSVRGQVVQRELTDEARKVLQAAKGNDRDFTSIGGSLDVIDVLQKSKNVRAKHLDEIMKLPRGAAPALESLVQACLVRYFVLRVLGEAQTLGQEKPSTAAIQAIIKAVIAEVSIIKESLRASGYPGAGALTTQLYSMMQASFGALNPAVHGLQHDTSVDPRTLEVCRDLRSRQKGRLFPKSAQLHPVHRQGRRDEVHQRPRQWEGDPRD